MTRFAQPRHFHLHCISWKSDFGLIGLICLRRIWEFQPAGVIDWWTGWYEPEHSACPLFICWHAAPSPSWLQPYLTPTETTIVNHNSLQETNSRNKCICCQLFPLFRNNLMFAETKTHLHFTLNILIQTWLLAFIYSLEGRGLLFTSKPCCHKLLVHVQRSRIITWLICQVIDCPPVDVIIYVWAKRGNVFYLSSFSEVGPQRSEQAFQAEHLGECFNSLCLHHSCGQRLHHSIWRSAAHPGLLSPFPHCLNAFWSGPLLFICANGQN